MGLIGWLIAVLAVGVPVWKLLPRAGMPQTYALVSVVPILGLVLLWVIAFRAWPGDDVSGRFQ